MRFLNPFSRSSGSGKRAARGGSKRKVRKSTRRRAGINWRLVRRAVPAGALVAAVGGFYWLYQDRWLGRQAGALQAPALVCTSRLEGRRAAWRAGVSQDGVILVGARS